MTATPTRESSRQKTNRSSTTWSTVGKAHYISCRKCGHRNDRVGGRQRCVKCGATWPKLRGPKHDHARQLSHKFYAELQRTVHGVNENECGLCGGEAKDAGNLDRDHAHHDGGYPRGLLHPLCNKRLGEVERGQDGEAWLAAALDYVVRPREHHEREAAA